LLPRAVPDEVPPWMAESTPPGAGAGVPSLLLADPVTPYVAAAARKAGYADAIPADTPPRLLYRAIGRLLQQARRPDTRPADQPAGLGKLTLQ
jgi:hypothetical protein